MSLVAGTYREASLVFIEAITPVHVGTGRAIGVVDLPIQRDAFGYPVIPPSSLKGPLRARFVSELVPKLIKDGKKLDEAINEANRNPIIKALFGPPPEVRGVTEMFTGAIAILEGKLLAIPARSLRGVWIYITTPQLLRYFKTYTKLYFDIYGSEDAKRYYDIAKALLEKTTQELSEDTAIVTSNALQKTAIGNEIVLNEEFKLKVRSLKEVDTFLNNLPKQCTLTEVGLAVVPDTIGREIIERSIIRQARVRLKPAIKVVDEGPWLEENVPEYTIFVTVFLYSMVRKADVAEEFRKLTGKEPGEKEIKEYITEKLKLKEGGYLILGGHETIGRGIVKLLGV